VRSRWMAAAIVLCAWCATASGNPLQARIELKAASKIERNAGVWLDGQYLGALGDLRGKGRITVLPGERHVLVKLAGYEDVSRTIVVEPGQRYQYRVAMQPSAGATYPDADLVAELRIAVRPNRAAVFVNDVYAGHVSRFNGRNGLRVRAGTHRVKITLPGYQPFETEVTLLAGQKYEIKTDLPKGSITQQSRELIVTRGE
jgi:hypothetical protein